MTEGSGDIAIAVRWTRLSEEYRPAIVVGSFTAAYALIAYIVSLIGNDGRGFTLSTYWKTYYLAYGIGVLFILLPRFILLALSPFWPRAGATADRILGLTSNRLREVVPVLLLFPFALASYTSIKTGLADLGPFTWDATFADLDRFLHFGFDPWLLLNPVLGDPATTRTIQRIYAAWGVVMTYSLLFVSLWEHDRSRRFRFYAAFFLVWPLLGNLLAWVFYSAGPVFLAEIDPSDRRFEALSAFVATLGGEKYSAHDFQQYLWRAYEAGRSQFGTGISAFPSMHVSIATLVLLAGWGRNRVAVLAGALFLLSIQLGSVHLGWHYAVDGYASMILTVLIWLGIGKLIDANNGVQPRIR